MIVSEKSRIKLKKMLGEQSYVRIARLYSYFSLRYISRELGYYLKQNEKFKDIHKGKRCFILGNGPSLKQQDLTMLENEIVFTCNQIARNPDFKKIRTNYHFWADPIFFNLDENKPEDMELLEIMKSVNTNDNSPQCFFAAEALDLVKKYKLDNYLNINFYKQGHTFNISSDIKTDFTKMVSGFHTVVQYAIAMAIYMGCSHLYILGSEMTGILTSINIRLQNNLSNDYAYELSGNEQQRMLNRTNVVTFEDELNSFYNVIKTYRILNNYCINKGISLINCTPGGLVESLHRKKYEEVIASGGGE